MSKLILTRLELDGALCDIAALYEEGRMTEVRLSQAGEASLLGKIYVAQVDTIAAGIGAAFVRISSNEKCYLSLGELPGPLHQGDQVVVQVNRDAIKSKLPAVTTRLNFTGKYLVLTTQDLTVGFSKKLSKKQCAALQSVVDELPELKDEERSFGLILRTNAKEASREELLREFSQLKAQMEQVREQGPHRTKYSCLYQPPSPALIALRDVYRDGLEEVITDQKDLYEELQVAQASEAASAAQSAGEEGREKKASLLRLYDDPLLPLPKLFSMERELDRALAEKVWLKSGGFLVLQQTEACVVIDVNSGKYEGKKSTKETYRKINLEAAREIARQIRLRNLSGILLIDFINMEETDQEELLRVLRGYVKADPVRTTVVDITALHILEMTRRKVRKSLAEEVASLRNH